MTRANRNIARRGARRAAARATRRLRRRHVGLEARLEETKKRPGGRIEPLPEVKPYETFIYDPSQLRSPFQPRCRWSRRAPAACGPTRTAIASSSKSFSLDTLKMVGTLRQGGKVYGLVQTKDGLVHKVLPGNYLGQNDGKVTEHRPNRRSASSRSCPTAWAATWSVLPRSRSND